MELAQRRALRNKRARLKTIMYKKCIKLFVRRKKYVVKKIEQMHFLLSQNKSNHQIQNKIPTTYRNTLQTKTKTTVTMFQIKNSTFISFFLIATAISATNASGGKCWGQNNSCPDTLVNFAEMNGKTLCCSPNGGCGGATYTEGDGDDSTSNVQDCSEAVVESILSIEDTTSSGSASIFAFTASSIVAPFAVMLMN